MMYLDRYDGTNHFYYYFKIVEIVTDELSQDVMLISLPGQGWDEATFLRFAGQRRVMSITWWVHNDDTDKSEHDSGGGGAQTAPDPPFTAGVKTMAEQMNYLRDHVYTEEEDLEFTLFDTTYWPDGILVVPTRLTFTIKGDDPNEIQAQLEFHCAENMV